MRRLLLKMLLGWLCGSGLSLGFTQNSYLSANRSQVEVTELPRLLHYLPEDMPIKVFIPTPEGVAAESLQDSVEAAFLAWQQAVPDTVQIQFVAVPADDVLTVNFDPAQNGVGSYRYRYEVQADGQWRFRATTIFLNPTWDTAILYRYALVQVGHALGLLGRSPFEGDAMSMSPSGVISDRDVQTLQELYATPSGTVLRD